VFWAGFHPSVNPKNFDRVKIIADENIPYGRDAFSTLGEVVTLPGRAIGPQDVRDADLLMVRSVTQVNGDLLKGSQVRFVATATIGEDHIDKGWLAERGIRFASAPGCNANSVGDYLVAALLELAGQYGLALETMSLGIVGCGNVGRRVLQKATGLGLRCVVNDPPLARATRDARYRPLEEVLACDIVTTHVPLAKSGPDPTYHLVNEPFLRAMKPGSFFINTARGSVHDTAVLNAALRDGHLRAAVLDVWEGEPNVDQALLERVFIATPHIAGYSFDGKVNGTRQIYESACKFLGVMPAWDPAPLLPEPDCPHLVVDSREPAALRKAVQCVYPIREDDARMRAMHDLPEEARGAYFDRLRKEYPRRREFHNTHARVLPEEARLQQTLAAVGFQLD
jgi:erythronate-4-phosphate dehydrogenase